MSIILCKIKYFSRRELEKLNNGTFFLLIFQYNFCIYNASGIGGVVATSSGLLTFLILVNKLMISMVLVSSQNWQTILVFLLSFLVISPPQTQGFLLYHQSGQLALSYD